MKRKFTRLILTLVLLGSLAQSALATTWSPVEVICPVCKTKNTFMQIMSFGNYIYQWPSKFQYIFWPHTDSPVLYSCKKCHYTTFMWDFVDIAKEKIPSIEKMLAAQQVSGNYEKYTDIPMSQRLAIAEKVYSIIGKNDDWWCQFERIKGYHFSAEKNAVEAADARKKALGLAEKMLTDKQNGDRQKELLLITGSMRYFLKDEKAAIRDFEQALKLKYQDAKLGPEKSQNVDQYLSQVLNDFISVIHDEEKARTEPVRPGVTSKARYCS